MSDSIECIKVVSREEVAAMCSYYTSTVKSATVAIDDIWNMVKMEAIRVFIARYDQKIVGVLLSYPHYSTWVAESVVIRTIIAENNDIKVSLFESVIAEGKERGISRFDLFSKDENTIEVAQKTGFTNLTVSEDWHSYCLTVSAS